MYLDGRGLLPEALANCADRGFTISDFSIKHRPEGSGNGHRPDHVTVDLELRGQGSVAALASELGDLPGVLDVHAGEANEFAY